MEAAAQSDPGSPTLPAALPPDAAPAALEVVSLVARSAMGTPLRSLDLLA
jgi:hypothetical protein